MRSTSAGLFPQSKTSWPFFAQSTAKAVPHPPAPRIAVVSNFTFAGTVVLFRREDEKHLSDGEQSQPPPGKWKNKEGRAGLVVWRIAAHRLSQAVLLQLQSMQPTRIGSLETW